MKKGARPLGASFFLVGVDVEYKEDGIRKYIGVHSLKPDGSSENIYAGAIGSKSVEVSNILSSCYDNEECVDMEKAWGIAKKCVYEQFHIQALSSQSSSQINNENENIEDKDTCNYVFEAIEGKFVHSDEKLTWTVLNHDQIVDLLHKV